MNLQIILIASIFLLLVLVLVPIFIRRSVMATIDGFSWTRKLFFEHLLWVEETSYSGFPEGSVNQQSSVETYYSSQIVSYTTQTTQVNGVTSTTSQPVYGMVPQKRIKYRYEIQRWFKSRELVSEGNEHDNVYWPSYTLDASTLERVEAKKETYLVFFRTAKGKQYQEKLAESDWNALDDTLEYELRINLYGKIINLPEVINRDKAVPMDNFPQKMP
jgi:hypothetical protein